MAVLYPDSYGSSPKTIEEVFARSSVQMLHPEYQRRWKGLMVASGGKLGVGGAGRSMEQQKRVFLERHYQVGSGGCCGWDGKRWQLRKGMAHAAPPGRSFHETVVYGKAAAVDAVGDLGWAGAHCEEFGLEQATWGGENWHFQFTEFPHSVTQWKNAGSPQPGVWKLPNEPEPPKPPDPPKPPEEPDMTPEQMDELVERTATRTTELVFERMMPDLVTSSDLSFENMVRYTRSQVNKIDQQVNP